MSALLLLTRDHFIVHFDHQSTDMGKVLEKALTCPQREYFLCVLRLSFGWLELLLTNEKVGRNGREIVSLIMMTATAMAPAFWQTCRETLREGDIVIYQLSVLQAKAVD